MALCIPLPDAPPVSGQDGDQWHFHDNEGHDDWVLWPEYLSAMHARYASSVWYTVQRYPGATVDELADAAFRWMVDTDPRWHPSLSAAERNA